MRLFRIAGHATPFLLCALAMGCLEDRLDAVGPRTAAAVPRTEITDLWDLAPADAVSGGVLQDGVLARALAFVADPTDSPARTALHELVKDRWKLPFDPLSGEGWTAAGLDPSKGAAGFGFADEKRGVLLVLPVVDRARFRQFLGLATKMVDGRELDVLRGETVCDDVAGRYLCAREPEIFRSVALPHGSPLAEAARASDDRGDFEMFATRDEPGVVKGNKRPDAPGVVTAVTGALRLRNDGVELHLAAHGSFATPEARGLYSALPPEDMVTTAAGAASFARLHVEPVALWKKRDMPEDLRKDLAEQLLGDVEILTPARGFASATLVAPVADTSRVEGYLKKRCAAEAAKGDGKALGGALGGFKVEPHGCSGVFDTRGLLVPVRFPRVPIRIEAIASNLLVTLGASEKEPALFAFGAPETEAAQRAVEGPSTLVFVGHDLTLGPEVGAGAMIRDAIPLLGGRVADAVEAWNYAAAHVFEGLVRARVTDENAEITIELTTFGKDPPAAQEAYADAVAKRFVGDDVGYRAALASIEQRFPKTRAARRAAEVKARPSFLGVGTALLATLGVMGDGGEKKR